MCAHLIAVINPPLVAFLDRTKCDVGEQRRDHSALGRAGTGRKKEPFLKHSGLQELPNQSRHLQITDACTNALHQQMVIDLIEAALDIALDDPLIRRPLTPAIAGLGARAYGRIADMLQSTVAASVRGGTHTRHARTALLEDRLQKLLDRALNDTVRDRPSRDSQGSELPWLAGLGNQLPPARASADTVPVLRSSLSFARKASLPCSPRILLTVIPSIPAVRLPLLLAMLRQAQRSDCGDQLPNSTIRDSNWCDYSCSN